MLNNPPFLNGESQLGLSSENETRQIASVCVHVERAIERVKNFQNITVNFPLLNGPRTEQNMDYMSLFGEFFTTAGTRQRN